MPEIREAEQAGLAALRDAYPDPRELARAERWLGWIAWQLGARSGFGWWDIPGWLGEKSLRFPRLLFSALLTGVAYGAGFALYAGRAGLAAGLPALFAAGYVASKIRPGWARRQPSPLATRPRPPRSGRETAAVALAVISGVRLRRVLSRQWAYPVADEPGITPDASYQACRAATVIDLVAALAAGLPLGLIALFLDSPVLGIAASAVSAVWLLAALADGKVPAVWAANAHWWLRHQGRWPGMRRMLGDATRRAVLTPAGARYEFRDPAVQRYLAGQRQAGLDSRRRAAAGKKAAATARQAARKQRYDEAVAAADGGLRRGLLALLSTGTCERLALILGCGTGAATLAGLLTDWIPTWHSVLAVLGGLLGAVLLTVMACLGGAAGALLVLIFLADRTRWSLWLTGRMSPRVRVAAAASVVAAAGLITLAPGPAALRHAIAAAAVALMAPLTVAVTGGWAAVLANQRWHGAARRLPRHLGDMLAAATTCVVVLLLARPDLLGAQAAAGLLFPVAVWLSIRAWRAMDDSDRFPVRAAADITASVLLGAALTGLLAWLANVLRMPPDEVAILHDAVEKAGRLTDVPWWAWASAYTVLAAASLAFARWHARLDRVIRWCTRLRVVPSAEVLRRGLGGVHTVALLVLLVGAAAPAAIGPVLRARLADRYTQTLTAIARARGETAGYRTIISDLPVLTPALLIPLADLVGDVHKISKQRDAAPEASPVELDLAHRLGELQAATLTAGANPPPVERTEAAATRTADVGAPGDAAAQGERLGKVGAAEHEEQDAERRAEQTGELAATAIATALRLPGLGDGEVTGILREYLSGLIEFSPLKDTLAAWTERLAGATAPPGAEELIVPDPGRLRDAAAAQVSHQVAAHPVADSLAVTTLLGETGIAGAVDLVNQTRYLQENGSGPCEGCARPESPADHNAPGEPLDEPHFVP